MKKFVIAGIVCLGLGSFAFAGAGTGKGGGKVYNSSTLTTYSQSTDR